MLLECRLRREGELLARALLPRSKTYLLQTHIVVKLYPMNYPKNSTRSWLSLGVIALALAGLYAVVLVVARSPQIKTIPLFANLFHEALVVHVDLSVLVWFLCIACAFWHRSAAERVAPALHIPYLEQAAFMSMGGGILFMVLSPLDTQAEPLMSNYIPVITSPVFFLGLMLVFCAVVLSLARLALAGKPLHESWPFLHLATSTAAITTVISAAAFLWSFSRLPAGFESQQYYEIAFWAGGHVLQFTHIQFTMLAWLLMARALAPERLLPARFITGLFLLAPVITLFTPYAYVRYAVESMEHREFFTHMMIFGMGLAPTLLACLLWRQWVQRPKNQRALWAAFAMSVLLFLFGGLLGLLIRGQNVVIPAHYHGSIVGMTLAFMGLAIWFLPQLGGRNMANTRLALLQPFIYGGGQVLHITGLAISGGYGALRKTPGTDGYPPQAVAAMGAMGLGGLLAVLGGILFVVIMWRGLKPHEQNVS